MHGPHLLVIIVFCAVALVPNTDSSIIPAMLKTSPASKFAATSIAYLSLSSPFGNIGSAVEAIIKDPEAITCSLDTMLTDENHGSCQQLDRVVRVRAGKLLTIKQVRHASIHCCSSVSDDSICAPNHYHQF